MPLYEVTCIMPSEMNKEDRDKIIDKIKNSINGNDGEIKNIEEIGIRKIAYEVENALEGFFITFYLQMNPSQIENLRKFLASQDKIRRLMIIRMKNSSWGEKKKKGGENNGKP
ncbi:30S ribosomal protein S6 [Candidatus Aerophobetes bacterium]|nr:30S ribosomal protein S6 [Candidatus Aerophobetes bacterium]